MDVVILPQPHTTYLLTLCSELAMARVVFRWLADTMQAEVYALIVFHLCVEDPVMRAEAQHVHGNPKCKAPHVLHEAPCPAWRDDACDAG